MKIRHLLYHFFLLLLTVSTTTAQPVKATAVPVPSSDTIYLSLEEVLRRIQCENLTVLLNREKVEEALRNSYMVGSALFPQVSASVSQSRSQQFINLSDSLGGSFTDINNNFRATLEGSLSVVDTRKYSDYLLAKKGHRISQFQYQTIFQDVMAEAARAYYLHERNIKRMKVLHSNKTRDEFLFELASARFNAGVATAIDVTRAEVQVSQDKRDILQHETVLLVSEINLKLLLDLDLHCKVEIQEVASVNIKEKPDLSRDFFQALCARSEYHEAYEQLDFYKLEGKAALLDYVPKFDVNATSGYASTLIFDSRQRFIWTVGASVSMPIFDGFRIFNDKFRADALVRAQKYSIKDISNKIQADLILNQQAMDSRFNQIILTRDQVMLGDRELELASARFQEGVADNQEIVLAQANLSQFLDDLVNVVYLFDLSRVEWARTMGNVNLLISSEET